MPASDYGKEFLDFALKLAEEDNRRMRLLATALANYSEYQRAMDRWLEKDYDDQKNGDWTR